MSDIDSISEDLFFKLRNRFPKINMGDENGQTTTNPLESRFFMFTYEHDNKKYGKVTCSVIDNSALKVYFSQDILEGMSDEAETDWFQFLKELRKFAKTNMLMFDVRDITKDALDQKDIEFTSKYHKEKTAVQESKINWERHGRFSEGNHKSIKIHVVHNNKLDENPNNRLVGIEKMYLVNENKERFLLPFVSIRGAKAMAMHCAQGGTPYDADGVTITKAVAEMKNLSRFGQAVRNKTFESEEPMKVIRASKHIKEQLKRNLDRMAGSRNFEEGIEGLRSLLATESTDKTEVLKDWFIQKSYDDKLDTWLESATNAIRRCIEQNINLSEDEDKMDYSDAILDKDQSAKRAANPAQIGASVELYANPAKDDEMKHLVKTQPMRGMIRLILADIASRAVDDETAILASKADMGEFTMQHRKMLEAYLKDLFSDNPPRKEPEAKKDIHGKKKTAEEEFEEAVMGMGEPEEEEAEESIGDKHKRERFKSLNKIKTRLKQEEEEELEEEDTDEGIRSMKRKDTSWKDVHSRKAMDTARPADYRPKHEPSKADVRSELEKAMADFLAKGGKVKRASEDDEHVHEAEMEAGECNMTSEGSMCPVHGLEECPTSGTLVVGEEEATMEEIKRMLKLAGLNENWDFGGSVYGGGSTETKMEEDSEEEVEEEGKEVVQEKEVADEGNEFSGARADAIKNHKDHFEVGGKTYKVTEVDMNPTKDGEEEMEEASKPDFLDVDKDGNKDEPMKKALKDKERSDEALEILKKAAGIW